MEHVVDGMAAHGRHVLLDYVGFVTDAGSSGPWLLEVMGRSLHGEAAREVHRHLTVLGEDGTTPPGFTSAILIDESHITAHCYSDRGWLALDVFTCGASDPDRVADRIHHDLVERYPNLRLVRREAVARFLHEDVSNEVNAAAAAGTFAAGA